MLNGQKIKTSKFAQEREALEKAARSFNYYKWVARKGKETLNLSQEEANKNKDEI